MMLCPYCHNPLSNADVDQLKARIAQLRKLVYDMLEDEERGDGGLNLSWVEKAENDDSTFYEHVKRANELGVEWN